MANVHNLDLYPCTGARSCVGCVPVAEASTGAPEASAATHAEGPRDVELEPNFSGGERPASDSPEYSDLLASAMPQVRVWLEVSADFRHGEPVVDYVVAVQLLHRTTASADVVLEDGRCGRVHERFQLSLREGEAQRCKGTLPLDHEGVLAAEATLIERPDVSGTAEATVRPPDDDLAVAWLPDPRSPPGAADAVVIFDEGGSEVRRLSMTEGVDLSSLDRHAVYQIQPVCGTAPVGPSVYATLRAVQRQVEPGAQGRTLDCYWFELPDAEDDVGLEEPPAAEESEDDLIPALQLG